MPIGPISSPVLKPSFDPFDVPAVPVKNVADPDQAFYSALERGRSASLVFGIQGNVVAQAAVYGIGHATRNTWLMLQLNPFTRHLYDGVVKAP